jgi:LacI family transcriptional regulator
MSIRPPTSHDVARAAGVSQPTVSRALRDDAGVADATRRRVRQVAAELGYVRSQRGRSLSMRATGQIGIVIRDLANPFYLQLLEALNRALHEVDLRMLVLTPDDDNRVPLERLVDGALDGALLTTTELGSSLPRELARRQFPFVLLNREVDDAPGDVCVADNVRGGELVAAEFALLGHRRIGAVFGPQSTSTGRDREQGFRAGLAAAGLELPAERWRRGPFDFDFGHAAALELLAAEPTAIFCANDVLAIGAYNGLRSRGLRVPQDVTLVGFDDIAIAAWEVFELTTVSQHLEQMVQTSTELLLDRIADPDLPPRRVVLPATFIHRKSHAPPAA